MCRRILAIETAGPQGRARRLVFSDDSEPRTTAAAVVKDLAIEPGIPVDDELAATMEEAETRLAKDRALRLLGYRDFSVSQMFRKLADDGYPSRVQEQTVARLVELGLLDDTRYSAQWVQHRIASGYGRRRILHELRERGIDADVATLAMDDACDTESEVERARACCGDRRPVDRKERERLLRRLLARGFDASVALSALDAFSPSDHE